MPSVVFVVLCVGTLSCQHEQHHTDPVVLVVSAGHQLAPFPSWQGSVAYALELVYERAASYADIRGVGDREVIVVPKPESGYSPAFLCDHLAGQKLAHKPWMKDGVCHVEFEPDVDVATQMDLLIVDSGPFRVGLQGPIDSLAPGEACAGGPDSTSAYELPIERIVLCKRGDTEIDEIHLIAMPLEQQWRSFFAGHIDVIPHAPAVSRHRFDGMDSVRVVRLSGSIRPWSLLFNHQRPLWSNVDMRRYLARALDLDAIARVACRDPECRELGRLRIEPREDVPPARGDIEAPPSSLRLLLPRGVGVLQAGKVLQYQLFQALAIDVQLDRVPLADFQRVRAEGDYDLVLLPVPDLEETGIPSLSRKLHEAASYDNSSLEQAVEQQRYDDAAAILRRDVPLVPLFQDLSFAVISEQFCGGQPRLRRDWQWLRDLHPCDQESTP